VFSVHLSLKQCLLTEKFASFAHMYRELRLCNTRSSATAGGPRDALCL